MKNNVEMFYTLRSYSLCRKIEIKISDCNIIHLGLRRDQGSRVRTAGAPKRRFPRSAIYAKSVKIKYKLERQRNFNRNISNSYNNKWLKLACNYTPIVCQILYFVLPKYSINDLPGEVLLFTQDHMASTCPESEFEC